MSLSRVYDTLDEPVPGYRLVRFLGRGGFGEVWQASAPGGTQVAIKIINLGTKQGLKEFRALRLVKQIQHANLVPISAFWLKDREGGFLDESCMDQEIAADSAPLRGTMRSAGLADTVPLGTRPTELIIAMGLGHKSLIARLEECQQQGLPGIPVDELLGYMQDTARAIDYLNGSRHDLGSGPVAIQHCDIKPHNILIVGDAAQVCDFGLARVLGDLRKTTAAGSVAYIAPECIESNTPSPATDQYSLAVTYVELRTGALPFAENSGPATILKSHLTGSLDLSKLPPAEREVIRKATAPKPADRFHSAGEMVRALRQATEATDIKPSAPERQLWLRRALVALALVSMAAVGYLMWPDKVYRPPDCQAAPGANVVAAEGRKYFDRIVCRRHGLAVPFVLIPKTESGQPDTFYIMQDKVSNDQFRKFAEANPQLLGQSQWQLGGINNGNDAQAANGQWPVLRVTFQEAWDFAAWLGGRLPDKDQWDMAAGRFHEQRSIGPFRGTWDSAAPLAIAVNRGAEGPLEVGTAAADVSLFGVRDMAGNGQEWTRTLAGGIDAALEKPEGLVLVKIRGRPYWMSSPLTFETMDNQVQESDHADPYTSFRVVLDQLPR